MRRHMSRIATLIVVSFLGWVYSQHASSSNGTYTPFLYLPATVTPGETFGVMEPTAVIIRNTEPIISPPEPGSYLDHQWQRTVHFTRSADTLQFNQIRILQRDVDMSWETGRHSREWYRHQTRVEVVGEEADRVLLRTITDIPSPTRYSDWFSYSHGLRPCPRGALFFVSRDYFNRMAATERWHQKQRQKM